MASRDAKERRYESMLYDYRTTMYTDYRDGEIKYQVKTTYKAVPKRRKRHSSPMRDTHTLNPYKNPNFPFDLMTKPKEIIRTDPRVLQKHYERPKDLELEEVIKTRPRLVMTPAISLDDVEDPVKRSLLVDDMYTSTLLIASRESAAVFTNNVACTAPLVDRPAPPNPIKLPKVCFPYITPEWRMESVPWDGKQVRSYCAPTAEFWKRRDNFKCKVCDQTAALQAQAKMANAMKRQRRA